MLDRMSPRQKARGALAVLNLATKELSALDAVVDSICGHPLVGALIGVDARSVEEVLVQYFGADTVIDTAVFAGVRSKLSEPKFRSVVASAIYRALSALPEQHAQYALLAIQRLAEMDFPEFQGEFDNVQHFLAEGLLKLLSMPPEINEVELEMFICPGCGEAFHA